MLVSTFEGIIFVLEQLLVCGIMLVCGISIELKDIAFSYILCTFGSIVVSIPACHAGDQGSIPRRRAFSFVIISMIYRYPQRRA